MCGGLDGRESPCSGGDPGLIPGLVKSPGEGNDNPLHCSCLGIPWTEEPDQLQPMEWQRVKHN